VRPVKQLKVVAVIGGGPAGATAAEKLARGRTESGPPVEREIEVAPGSHQAVKDHSLLRPPGATLGIGHGTRVLLFEERPAWEKPCGGGLPYKALERYPFLLDATDPHVCVRDAELVAADGESARFRLPQPLAIYSRATLNRLLLRRADEAGAEIVEDRISDFRRSSAGWKLEGRRAFYSADYLILAAGARTRLRGRLAAHFATRDFMLTFGYYIPRADNLLRVQFFRDFEGYAWSFPRPDHLSVGICGKAGENRMPELRERLHGFMQRFGYDETSALAGEQTSVFSHLLPALSPESWHNLTLLGADWALAGDAAGLADPVTGEGIYFAMRSGELLAQSLLAAAPETYPERVWQDFGRKLLLGSRLARPFYREDFLGQPSTTRLVQFASRSQAFMKLLETLIAGTQSYSGLAFQLYKTLAKAAIETATDGLRNTPLAVTFR
jgi:flavin-dependent dehydrogenase